MWCETTVVTLGEAIIVSVIWTAIYVLVLYLPFNSGPRDARRTIISRLVTLSIVAMGFELHLNLRLGQEMRLFSSDFWRDGRPFWHTIRAVIVGTFLTALLYTGHIAVTPPRPLVAALHRGGFAGWHVHVRNYVLAPLLEEIVFRRQFIHLYSCRTITGTFLAAALFALAHVHHVHTMGLTVVLFQMTYTFLFGVYALMLYIHTQSIWSSFAAHVVCNVLELPDLAAIAAHPLKRLIIAGYLAAVIMFATSFSPMTAWVAPYDTAAA